MKKLALASVAFAGICAYGAGNAFASPSVTFSTNPNSVASWNDEAQWVPGQGGALTVSTVVSSTTGLYSISTSVTSNKGVTVTATVPDIFLGASTSTSLYNGVQNGDTRPVAYTYPTGTSVLFGSSGNSMQIDLSSKVEGVGFYLSPNLGSSTVGTTFYTRVSVYGSGGMLLGQDTISRVFQQSCTGDSCAFVSSSVTGATAAITSAIVEFSTSSGFGSFDPPTVGPVYLNEPSQQGGGGGPEDTPEPASLSVLGMGLLGLSALRRRRKGGLGANGLRQMFGRWRSGGIPPDSATSAT
jgi:hypothetical protein